MNDGHLHWAHYVVPVAIPLLFVGAVLGRYLDNVLEHVGQARTALVVASMVMSAIALLVTLAIKNSESPSGFLARSAPCEQRRN
jgi:hypothetical protein